MIGKTPKNIAMSKATAMGRSSESQAKFGAILEVVATGLPITSPNFDSSVGKSAEISRYKAEHHGTQHKAKRNLTGQTTQLQRAPVQSHLRPTETS